MSLYHKQKWQMYRISDNYVTLSGTCIFSSDENVTQSGTYATSRDTYVTLSDN